MTIYECNNKTVYKVTGEATCDRCGKVADGSFTIRCLDEFKRIVGPDEIGRVYRKCKYVTRPENMCECSTHVWIASDVVAAENS